jgi:clan AA aspartic protease
MGPPALGLGTRPGVGENPVGAFNVTLQVADRFREQFVILDALVDTGATYTALPGSVLDGLGIEREETRRFRIADSRVVEYSMGETRLRLEGREFTAPVIFAPDQATPLVGMTTLEILGLGVDPIEERLVPVIALGR